MQAVYPECNRLTEISNPSCPKCGASLANAKVVAAEGSGAATPEIRQKVAGR